MYGDDPRLKNEKHYEKWVEDNALEFCDESLQLFEDFTDAENVTEGLRERLRELQHSLDVARGVLFRAAFGVAADVS